MYFTTWITKAESMKISGIDELKYMEDNLLDIMKKNEEGFIIDIDTESLYNFRVAVCQTRSAFICCLITVISSP